MHGLSACLSGAVGRNGGVPGMACLYLVEIVTGVGVTWMLEI